MQRNAEVRVTLSDELLDVLQSQARLLRSSASVVNRQSGLRHHRGHGRGWTDTESDPRMTVVSGPLRARRITGNVIV